MKPSNSIPAARRTALRRRRRRPARTRPGVACQCPPRGRRIGGAFHRGAEAQAEAGLAASRSARMRVRRNCSTCTRKGCREVGDDAESNPAIRLGRGCGIAAAAPPAPARSVGRAAPSASSISSVGAWKVEARSSTGSAGSASSTVTAMPRRCSAAAATRPTGPAPAIKDRKGHAGHRIVVPLRTAIATPSGSSPTLPAGRRRGSVAASKHGGNRMPGTIGRRAMLAAPALLAMPAQAQPAWPDRPSASSSLPRRQRDQHADAAPVGTAGRELGQPVISSTAPVAPGRHRGGGAGGHGRPYLAC